MKIIQSAPQTSLIASRILQLQQNLHDHTVQNEPNIQQDANEHGLRQQHNENIVKGILKNAETVSGHRSMLDTVTSSGDDISDKRAKQALENAHVVSWLNNPPTYERGESGKHRRARLRAGFTLMDQFGLGRNGVAIDRREGGDKDETLSSAQGAPPGLEGVGAWGMTCAEIEHSLFPSRRGFQELRIGLGHFAVTIEGHDHGDVHSFENGQLSSYHSATVCDTWAAASRNTRIIDLLCFPESTLR